jgi:hypothetical protein
MALGKRTLVPVQVGCWISAFPAVVAMVDRAVRVDWLLLVAGGVATSPDAESRGACAAGRNGVAH